MEGFNLSYLIIVVAYRSSNISPMYFPNVAIAE